MQHNKKRTIRIGKSRREALLRSLAQSLILHEQIKTTETRAKILRGFVDKLINYAKKEDKVSAIRLLNKHLQDKNTSKKLMEVIAEKYTDKNSGYTRLIKTSPRDGDNAPMVYVQLT
ncbi:MAG: 50S ribosomal protein L17 [Patescibacteria group bacterium]|nr:50S ribosomal protein L17 [Patescibacteria group bacterium]